jgi:hypothetical protein
VRTKRNKKAVLVRIRIKIGIALKEIKTKGRQGPKGRKGSMAETNNKTVMIRINIEIAP